MMLNKKTNILSSIIFLTTLLFSLSGCEKDPVVSCLGKENAADLHQLYKGCKQQAEQGNADAQYKLARLYIAGRGVKQSQDNASKWANAAALQDHTKAMVMFASLTLDESKPSPNAIEWYTKAGERGDVYSQRVLGRLYLDGGAVEQNNDAAVYWFTKAAENGDVTDITNLAHLFGTGDEIPKNTKMALYWFRKAAAMKDSGAMHMLGVTYLFDKSLIDYDKAYGWLSLAKKYGHEYSDELIEELESTANEKAIAYARRMADTLEQTYILD